MASISTFPTDVHADGVHGIPWSRIDRIKHAVCWKYYWRLEERIPLEEFVSEAHEWLAWAILHFDPAQGTQFPTFLHAVLGHHMGTVARNEWKGIMRREWDQAQRNYVKGSARYPEHDLFLPLSTYEDADDERPRLQPLPLCAPATQEAAALLRECLAHLETTTTSRDLTFFWHTVEGYESTEVAARYGTTKNAFNKRIAPLRRRLTAWAEGVSRAAD